MSCDTASSSSLLSSNARRRWYTDETDTQLSMATDENKYLMKLHLHNMSTINYKDENEIMDNMKSNEESQLETSYEEKYNSFKNIFKLFNTNCLNCIIMMLTETGGRVRGGKPVFLGLEHGLKEHIVKSNPLGCITIKLVENYLIYSKNRIGSYKTMEYIKNNTTKRRNNRKSSRHQKQPIPGKGKKNINIMQLSSSSRNYRGRKSKGGVLGGSGAGGKLMPP